MSAAEKPVGNEPVLLESLDGDGVLRLVLNRPAARNALSVRLMTALGEALDRAAANQGCRVVVIAGAEPGFCAGHDLRELRADPSRALTSVLPAAPDAADRPAGEAGDRRNRHRHRRRVPARRDLRSGGCCRRCAVCHPASISGFADPDGRVDPRSGSKAMEMLLTGELSTPRARSIGWSTGVPRANSGRQWLSRMIAANRRSPWRSQGGLHAQVTRPRRRLAYHVPRRATRMMLARAA